MEEAIAERGRATDPTGARPAVPYRPSWFDRLTAGIERLPGPTVLWYLGVGVGLAALFTMFKWVDGTMPVGTVTLYHLVFVGTPLYTLAATHLLDHVAAQALDEFRPVLAADATTTARLRYELTTLPATPTLLVTLVGAAGVLVVWSQLDAEHLVAVRPGLLLLITLLEGAVALCAWALVSIFIYHALHQLRVVTTIYTHYTHINLFTLGPLYAFSRLTALTAIAPVPVFLLDYLGWPDPGHQPVTASTLALWVVFGLLSVGTFVLPLLGVHRLLAQEKARAQLALAARLQALLADLHQQVASHAATADATTATKNLLDSLLAEQGLLNRVSTWPWAPETPRAVATALLLPVLVLILSEIVKRLFGF
jgi:hypothetical protein